MRSNSPHYCPRPQQGEALGAGYFFEHLMSDSLPTLQSSVAAANRDSCTGLLASAPGLPKGALSLSMIAFTMDHLPSMLEGQSINGLVVEYIGAIVATSIPGCCTVLHGIMPRDD